MSLLESELFKRLILLTPFSDRELITLIATAPTRYKDHYIEKRNGRGKRLISQPTKELKYLQKLLISSELGNLAIHPSATAYRPGRSIIDHAAPHASARYLLKLDFKDFFPSITSNIISQCLERDKEYTKTELWLITNILCKNDKFSGSLRLSIGAPSSPFISNYVMRDFDTEIFKISQSKNVVYTRYADDLAFSTSSPRTLEFFKSDVERLLKKTFASNLIINEEKTVSVSKKSRRSLVGLTLSNEGTVSVGRDAKRLIRAQFHKGSKGELRPEEVGALRGRMAFLLSVDPVFVREICARYGFNQVSDIDFLASPSH